MLRTHDNWERLVGSVIKKQQLWELCHAHSRSSSLLSEPSSFSDLSSSSFREINTSSAYQVRKLVFVSDFVPAFDVDDANLNSLKLLGTGTFANTYLGDVSDGIKIVVKRINKSVSVSEEEFKRFMGFVGSIRHENVVSLRVYYNSEDEKLTMYDFYGQGSVYQLLHGQTSETPPQVEWKTRLRIAIGAARGLAFIHAQNGGTLVHGNVKSTNIFLNQENYGSISDLGMINLIAANFRRDEHCHAPEVKHNTRNVSQESDVYSFEILLFELLTRKPSGGSPNAVDLVKMMKSVRRTNMTSKVFDPYLIEDPTIREHMVRVLQIGISCVVKSMKKRPKMSEVAKMLEDIYALNASERPDLVYLNPYDVVRFDLADLLCAITSNSFEEGTFGNKATLENGMVVRMKQIIDVNVTFQNFEQRMETISRINHKSCAKLKAYHFSKEEVLLVYDHFSHQSLSFLLHITRKPLDWETRFYFALTAAEGIAHIHGLMLVHGNINSSTIIVNEYNNAIITDTALWKLTEPIQNHAPEVEGTRNLSQASDVYGFGVVLLEIFTRRSPHETGSGDDVTSLVGLVRNHMLLLDEDSDSPVLDPELQGCDAMKEEMLKLAMDCMENAPQRRPKMFVVVKRLRQIQWQSLRSDSEHERPRLEDALEDQLAKLTT